MKRSIVFFFLFAVLVVNMNGQGRKDIIRNEVKTQVVNEYFIAEGIKAPSIERFQAYDAMGNVIEIKEFNKEGDVKLWERYEFNENGDPELEEVLDSKGNLIERVVIKYKNGLIISKEYYDKKERLEKRKEYIYEYVEEDK